MEISFLSECRVSFSLYVFCMKVRLSLILDLYISVARTANAFDESSVYFPKLTGHHM